MRTKVIVLSSASAVRRIHHRIAGRGVECARSHRVVSIQRPGGRDGQVRLPSWGGRVTSLRALLKRPLTISVNPLKSSGEVHWRDI